MGAIEYRVIRLEDDGETAVLDELYPSGNPSGDEEFQIKVTREESRLSGAEFRKKYRVGKNVLRID